MSKAITTIGTFNLAALFLSASLLAPAASLAQSANGNGGNGHLRCAGIVDQVLYDWDLDGLCDEDDNCTEVFNPDQRDTDNDGYGNACDCDYDNDGGVGITDFSLFFFQTFGLQLGDRGYNWDADHNDNDVIDEEDYLHLQRAYGKEPGPSGHHQ